MYIIIFLIAFFSSAVVSAQESKMLITQTACVDIPKILDIVNNNKNLQIFLLKSEQNYKKKSLSLEKKIQELEDYLLENENHTNNSFQNLEKIKQEIEYQKLELKRILLLETDDDSKEIILKGIYRLIKEVAEKEGLSIIIEKTSAVVYNKPEVDITDQIIQMMLNRSNEEESE